MEVYSELATANHDVNALNQLESCWKWTVVYHTGQLCIKMDGTKDLNWKLPNQVHTKDLPIWLKSVHFRTIVHFGPESRLQQTWRWKERLKNVKYLKN